MPPSAITTFERTYEFGWLGVLADVPPAADELIYANHPRGFALCSMRSPTRSRYYVQVPVADTARGLDRRDVLGRAAPPPARRRPPTPSTTGPSIEKSVAPLRSFVAEPLRFGKLFLCGDAGHIVPPTGAKGLNLAASDVHYLFEGLREHYAEQLRRRARRLFVPRALARVWKAQRFSTWMTKTLHNFPADGPVGQRLQEAELDYLTHSEAAAAALAENYVGLPY